MFRFRSQGLAAAAGGLFCLLLAASSFATSPVAAQERVTIRGRVADADDNPIAGAVVLLHAIGDDAGQEVTRDTADATGAFELAFSMDEGPLYFVATRVDGAIFMGDPFREVPAGELVLRAGAGVEPLDLGGVTPGPATTRAMPVQSAQDESRQALFWVLVIGGAVAALVAWLV
ncbi:MAG TPA: carboxypeptidase-like regulatory domain-containing protein, partial [Longimicrobiales bacterium]